MILPILKKIYIVMKGLGRETKKMYFCRLQIIVGLYVGKEEKTNDSNHMNTGHLTEGHPGHASTKYDSTSKIVPPS